MWLLSTDRAELHYFSRSFDAEGGYAILSHTWDKDGEQTFQQVRAIQERCRMDRRNPRDDPELSQKIRGCCILAEKHGYRWVWIDSCCIDKTNSTELSESINSMYRWYKSSEICYAYLKDVPSNCELYAYCSEFRKSLWHTRGWTLQELITPDSVVFISVDWRELGNRAQLAPIIEEITAVPRDILTGKKTPAEYPASNRMSWASRRKTTRIEDEAYCLMGLFGVSMQTNYGEGKKAFIRLQNEIMQRHCDMSLFAFGQCVDAGDIVNDGLEFNQDGVVDTGNSWQYLLADSPRAFTNTFSYIPDLGSNEKQQFPPLDSTTIGPFNSVELPHATVTSYGIECRLPVAHIEGVTIAVMLCKALERNFGLFLTTDHSANDPLRPRYFAGRGCINNRAPDSMKFLARMCDLGDNLYNLTFNGKPVKALWSTIYIVPTPSHFHANKVTSPRFRIKFDPTSPFHIPRWLVDRLIALQFGIDVLRVPNSWTTQALVLHHRGGGGVIILFIGICTNPGESLHLWAKVVLMTHIHLPEFTHDCSSDHLDTTSWATQSKVFGDVDRMVRLSFIPSHRTAKTTLDVHLELFGGIFEEILQEAGVSFPSLADLQVKHPTFDVVATSSSQPRQEPLPSPDPQMEATPPHNFSLCRHSSTILRTSFTGILHFVSMFRFGTTPAQVTSGIPVPSTHTP